MDTKTINNIITAQSYQKEYIISFNYYGKIKPGTQIIQILYPVLNACILTKTKFKVYY